MPILGSGLLGRKRPNLLDAYFAALGDAVLVRFRLEETSGTLMKNTGSTGVVCDGTISGTYTLGLDSGKPGAGKGIDCDGATTDVQFASTAAINGLTAFTILSVCRPDNAGESSQGLIVSKQNEFYLGMSSSQRLLFQRVYGTTTQLSITSVNVFTYGNVYAFAARLDDADKIGHIFINGVEPSYGTHTTGAGTTTSTALTNHLASVSGGITFDGGIFDVAIVAGALTDQQIGAHYEAAFLA